jgi:hypothetical protein
MLYKIVHQGTRLERCAPSRALKELELERLLVQQGDEGAALLSVDVFSEELLYITRQAYTTTGKRTDIIAMDRAGNLVVVELKRGSARLGVDTQALQYLADLSQYRGRRVIERFAEGDSEQLERRIRGFVGDAVAIEHLNASPRVILVARDFDEALLSMGEWLSGQGTAFRCVAYNATEIGGDLYLSFSLRFDRTPRSVYRLQFSEPTRPPLVFWHIVGNRQNGDAWWRFLKQANQISCSFQNQPGDRGEEILASYKPDDRIVAYCSGHGVVGWGVIPHSARYRLLQPKDKEAVLAGHHLHRLDVVWKSVAPRLADAIPASDFERSTGVYHPISTSSRIDPSKADGLIKLIDARFGK